MISEKIKMHEKYKNVDIHQYIDSLQRTAIFFPVSDSAGFSFNTLSAGAKMSVPDRPRVHPHNRKTISFCEGSGILGGLGGAGLGWCENVRV